MATSLRTLLGRLSLATDDLEGLRRLIFDGLLVVSGVASTMVAVRDPVALFVPEWAAIVRVVLPVWIVAHLPILLLSRTRHAVVAHVLYYLGALGIVTMLYQTSDVSVFDRVVLQLPQTFSLFFVAALLLPFRWCVVATSLTAAMLGAVLWQTSPGFDVRELEAAVFAIAVQILGQWALALLTAFLLGGYHRRLGRARQELEAANRDLVSEVEARVAELRDQQAQLVQAQRVEALGKLAGGVAHDFNNALTVILSAASELVEAADHPEEVRTLARLVEGAAQRSSDLTRALLSFARKRPRAISDVDVHALLNGLEAILRRSLGARVTLRLDLAAGRTRVRGDSSQLETAVLNICINARDAMPEGGTVTVATAAATVGERAGIAIRISDTGVGMSQEVRRHLFEPFFTTKPTGQGTGLGLAAAYGIVTAHGGSIAVESAPGRGSTFALVLPEADTLAEIAGSDTGAARASPALARRLLLVDDDELLRRSLPLVLRRAGYEVTACASGEEAVDDLVAGAGRPYALALVDLSMPGMDGAATMAALKRHDPQLPVVVVTGDVSEERATALTAAGASAVLLKPLLREAVVAAVERWGRASA